VSTLVLRPPRGFRARSPWFDALRGGAAERRLRNQATTAPLNLAFHQRGGPLLALAGVCGGAGTSTVAYLIAAGAALESSVPVLLADLGGPGASIAAYAGVASRQSFATIAEHLARGQRPREAPFASGEYGMRLLASTPAIDDQVGEHLAESVLEQAVAAHALTVLDCGQLTRSMERLALAQATHVGWVLPASTLGLRRASTLLGVLARERSRREVVIARHDRPTTSSLLDGLAQLAEERTGRLVLVPHLDDLAEHDTARLIEQAALALQALGGILHR
jgi:Flp pilus assembly CpaE family ATPase